MENWMIDFMEQFGYWGIFLMIAVENLFPPLPSEVILAFGGFMTTYSGLTIWGATGAATAGSITGAIILYGLGRLLDAENLKKLIIRWGSVLRLKPNDFYRADRWFNKHGCWTVFLCRMIPLLRSIISIPAGMARMNFGLFIFFTTLGTVIWNLALVSLGAILGHSWSDLLGFMDLYSDIVLLAAGIGLLCYLGLLWRRKKRRSL